MHTKIVIYYIQSQARAEAKCSQKLIDIYKITVKPKKNKKKSKILHVPQEK